VANTEKKGQHHWRRRKTEKTTPEQEDRRATAEQEKCWSNIGAQAGAGGRKAA